MDRGDDVRLGQGEQIVVADQVAGPVGEPLAAVAGLVRAVALDRRAHRAVDHHDPLAQGSRHRQGRQLRAQDMAQRSNASQLGTAGRAALQVAADARRVGQAEHVVGVGVEQVAGLVAVHHGLSPWSPAAERALRWPAAGSARNAAASSRRARDSRDITVPIGMSSTAAMSA